MSIERTFSVVDRKVDRYTFTLSKFIGRNTGTEYHVVDVAAQIGDGIFEKHAITLACPQGAIESIAADLVREANAAKNGGNHMILRKVGDTPDPNLIGGLLKKVEEPEKLALKPVQPKFGLKRIYDDDCDYCDDDDCDNCCSSDDDEDDDEAFAYCPRCGSELDDDFTFCPHCGKKLILA
jgi:hypothetical protein